jgi:hypothetical protein
VSKTITQLEAERDELLAPADIPGNWTPRERDAYETERSRRLAMWNTARDARAVLDEWEPEEAVRLAYYVTLDTVVLKKLSDKLLALGKPTSDYTRGVQQNLRLSLMALHNGLDCVDGSGYAYSTLQLSHAMLEAGLTTWRGGLAEARLRVKDAQHRVNEARQRWEWATLDDEERKALAEASAARDAEFAKLTKEERKARHEEQRRARGFGHVGV